MKKTKGYTKQNDEYISQMRANGGSWDDIAAHLKRTASGVAQRFYYLNSKNKIKEKKSKVVRRSAVIVGSSKEVTVPNRPMFAIVGTGPEIVGTLKGLFS